MYLKNIFFKSNYVKKNYVVFLCFVVGHYLQSMAKIVVSPSKKRTPPIFVVGVIDIQQIMLSGCFEGYILSRY